MRCYVAGIQHESNSFSPIPTSRRSFRTVRFGVDPVESTSGFGYGEACALVVARGWELTVGPFSAAQPSMPVATTEWQSLRDEIVAAAPTDVDIVLLCLHGAQMADGVDDCEADLIAAMRDRVGPHVAMGVLLDLHANVSAAMIDGADLVVSCRQYPHIDYGERADEMLPVLAAIRSTEVRPATVGVRFLAPGVYPTTEEPVAAFVARLTDAQRRPGVLMVAANHGFEGSDQPDTSASVVVTTDGDVELARSIAWEVSTDFCSTITSIPWRGPDVDAAVEAATTSVDRPVVIADGSDNAGGGAASDSTYLLAELLRRGVDEVAVALVWDRQAVTNCHVAGVGARLPLRIGGKSGPLSGDPVDVVAEVTSVRTDACQALFGVGEPSFPLGRSASIRVDGIDVVLNTSRQQVFSRHVFTEHGIDPAQRHILVVKSLQHFVHDFGPIAARVIRCDAPGTMTRDLSTFPFQRVRRPMRRLDDVDHLDLEEFAVAPP